MLRRAAIRCGPVPVRIREASSPWVTSRRDGHGSRCPVALQPAGQQRGVGLAVVQAGNRVDPRWERLPVALAVRLRITRNTWAAYGQRASIPPAPSAASTAIERDSALPCPDCRRGCRSTCAQGSPASAVGRTAGPCAARRGPTGPVRSTTRHRPSPRSAQGSRSLAASYGGPGPDAGRAPPSGGDRSDRLDLRQPVGPVGKISGGGDGDATAGTALSRGSTASAPSDHHDSRARPQNPRSTVHHLTSQRP